MKSRLVCQICKLKFKKMESHLRHAHRITIKQYYDTYLKKENEGNCLNCSTQTAFTGIEKGYRKFCSRTCCNDGKFNPSYTARIIKKCKNCKELMRLTPGGSSKIFCSIKCAATHYKYRVISDDTRELHSISMSNFIINNNGVNPGIIQTKKGVYYSKKNKNRLHYDSSWELVAYIILEKNNLVRSYKRCNFMIRYLFNNQYRHYNPDILVTWYFRHKEILEIKPKYKLKEYKNVAKFRAARRYVKQHNMIFSILTESQLFNKE